MSPSRHSEDTEVHLLARLYRVSDGRLVQPRNFWPREPLALRSGQGCRSGGFCACMYDLT